MVTVLAVRHADIDLPPDSDDPGLNPAGRLRAEVLAHLVGSSGVRTIFTSQFARTRQTVEPTARALGLSAGLAPPPPVLARDARAGQFGEVVLVAGHTNTVPTILAALGASSAPVIGEREFDNLFVLTTHDGDSAELLHLRYGAAG